MTEYIFKDTKGTLGSQGQNHKGVWQVKQPGTELPSIMIISIMFSKNVSK